MGTTGILQEEASCVYLFKEGENDLSNGKRSLWKTQSSSHLLPSEHVKILTWRCEIMGKSPELALRTEFGKKQFSNRSCLQKIEAVSNVCVIICGRFHGPSKGRQVCGEWIPHWSQEFSKEIPSWCAPMKTNTFSFVWAGGCAGESHPVIPSILKPKAYSKIRGVILRKLTTL